MFHSLIWPWVTQTHVLVMAHLKVYLKFMHFVLPQKEVGLVCCEIWTRRGTSEVLFPLLGTLSHTGVEGGGAGIKLCRIRA